MAFSSPGYKWKVYWNDGYVGYCMIRKCNCATTEKSKQNTWIGLHSCIIVIYFYIAKSSWAKGGITWKYKIGCLNAFHFMIQIKYQIIKK